MAEGQRLRWWQDETLPPASASRPAPPTTLEERTALIGEYRDVGEELEAEARTRAARLLTEYQAPSLDFFLDVEAAQRELRRQNTVMRWFFCSFLLVFIVVELLTAHHGAGHSGMPSGIGVFLCYLYHQRQVRLWLATLKKPVIRLSPEGIRVNTLSYEDRLLKWQDIISIKPWRFGRSRYLSIQTTQEGPSARRLEIVFSSLYLPFPPEEMAARIAAYREWQDREVARG